MGILDAVRQERTMGSSMAKCIAQETVPEPTEPTGPTELAMDDEGNEYQIETDGIMAFCADFDAIPTFTVTAKRFWEKQKSCPICLEKFAEGDLANKLPCGHVAHAACMEQWFFTDRTCPSCR